MQRPNILVQVRIRVAAAIVVIDDFFERRETSVVHIRSGARGLAEGGNLEGSLAGAWIGERAIAPRNPGAVERFVAEVRPGMAENAARFASEQRQTLFFQLIQRVLVSGGVAVKARISGTD